MLELVARWESRKGKHWVNLFRDGDCWMYRGNGCGAYMGSLTLEAAVAEIERKVATGYFHDTVRLTRVANLED